MRVARALANTVSNYNNGCGLGFQCTRWAERIRGAGLQRCGGFEKGMRRARDGWKCRRPFGGRGFTVGGCDNVGWLSW